MDIIQVRSSTHLWMYTQRRDQPNKFSLEGEERERDLRGLRGIRFCRFGKIQNHDLGDSNPQSMEFVTWSLPLGYAASDYLDFKNVYVAKIQLAHLNHFKYHDGGASKQNVF